MERVLGRERGLRIGEAPDRDGQYFHYLAMWLFALARLGDFRPSYRTRGIGIARDIRSDFFARASYAPDVRIAFANYGVSVGLRAADRWLERVDRLNAYFDAYRSGDEYDREAITHVMSSSSHLPGALIRNPR